MNAKTTAAPIPAGYHSVTPYLTVDNAAAAIEFYAAAFGAEERMRLPMGDKIGHAEIRIGDSIVMLSDEWPEMGMLAPSHRGGATSAPPPTTAPSQPASITIPLASSGASNT